MLIVHLVLTLLNLKVKASSFLRPVTTQSELFVPHPGVTYTTSLGSGESKMFHEPCNSTCDNMDGKLVLPIRNSYYFLFATWFIYAAVLLFRL